MNGDTLRGFVGQNMAARVDPDATTPYQFPPGSYSFTPPKAGYWKFVLWGGSGIGNGGAVSGSGAYSEFTALLNPSQTVAIVAGGASSVTFPNGKVVSAGAGADGNVGGAGGTASGGDVNLNGSTGNTAGSGTGGGAAGSGAPGAPANLPFRGGAGGSVAPGGGAGVGTLVATSGLVLAFFVRT